MTWNSKTWSKLSLKKCPQTFQHQINPKLGAKTAHAYVFLNGNSAPKIPLGLNVSAISAWKNVWHRDMGAEKLIYKNRPAASNFHNFHRAPNPRESVARNMWNPPREITSASHFFHNSRQNWFPRVRERFSAPRSKFRVQYVSTPRTNYSGKEIPR